MNVTFQQFLCENKNETKSENSWNFIMDMIPRKKKIECQKHTAQASHKKEKN